jgi:3D (Asp-Asp-Asp) domain-containing protein
MASLKHPLRRLISYIYKLFTIRIYAAIVLLCCLCGTMFYIAAGVRPVYIRDGDSLSLRYTFEAEPTEILRDSGITLMAFDAVDFTGFSGKMGVAEINITRGYPVYFTDGGATRRYMVAGHTLGELMAEQGIELGPYDELSHNPNYQLEENDHIVLRRVEVMVETTQAPIPYKTEYRENSLLRTGRSKVLIPGQDGLMETTISRRIVDGQVEEERTVEERVLRQPVTRVVLTGRAGVPVSKLDFGIPTDEAGRPLSYKYVLENQVATGYSAGKGAWGASGLDLFYGYVAVRADQIPYGTRLYIASADGSFVYGYAIAADTGIGLMQNVIDVDLYYETYEESRLNGRRNVRIYVLD